MSKTTYQFIDRETAMNTIKPYYYYFCRRDLGQECHYSGSQIAASPDVVSVLLPVSEEEIAKKVKNEIDYIAGYVIDNRYPKSEKEKVSDIELFQEVVRKITTLYKETIK